MSKLTFSGGAGTVTGANFLLETDDLKILVDCGLVQDKRVCHGCNYEKFPYNASEIEGNDSPRKSKWSFAPAHRESAEVMWWVLRGT